MAGQGASAGENPGHSTDRSADQGDTPPPGTLVPRDARRTRRSLLERWQLNRRGFLAGSVLAGVAAGIPVACAPRSAGELIDVPEHGHGWRPDLPLLRPAPDDTGTGLRDLEPHRDPLPIPPVLRPDPATADDIATGGRVIVRMRTAQVRLHSQLPPTTLYTYEGGFVGPTIEARRGQPLGVTWVNELSGPYPLTAVEVLNPDGYFAEWDMPGRRGAEPLPEVAALPAWTVVHLHGALTGGGNDGWPENALPTGGAQTALYENDQPAAALWYHDHAMHISRYNTMAGLGAGMYLLRDDEEDALDLPRGDREVPLVLCDRNLDLDSRGRLTGDLLYKITVYDDQAEKIPRSFTGPFTAVNGVIWPHLDVQPARYRFRILNSSTIRQYDLVLKIGDPVLHEDGFEDTADTSTDAPAGTVVHIGSDAGLLGAPIPVDRELNVSPAERADVVIDFSAFAGQTLRWVDDCFIQAPGPHVIQFRVADAPPENPPPLPARLARSYRSVATQVAEPLTERFVLITPAFPAVAQMWEMEPVDLRAGGPVEGVLQYTDADGAVRSYRRVASEFAEGRTWTARAGGWERWTYLSLETSGVAHPMHVHAFTFQVESRTHYAVDGAWQYLRRPDGRIGGGTTAPLRRTGPGTVLDVERGWKDVVRVGFGELVSVVGRFGPASGRFLHHCHVYEHEDHKMMRPLSVLPAEILRADPHEGGHLGGNY